MAQKLSVTFACDYDQKSIPAGQHETRRFSLDGRNYEIDLCTKHSQKFDDVVGVYTDHARRAASRARTKRRTTAHRQHSAAIRSWAKETGIAVSDRGRIPADVVARYEAKHA